MKTVIYVAGIAAIVGALLFAGGIISFDASVTPRGEEVIDSGTAAGKEQLNRGLESAREKLHEVTAPEQSQK